MKDILLEKMNDPFWAIKFSQEWVWLNEFLVEKNKTLKRLDAIEEGITKHKQNITSMLNDNAN